MEILILQVFVSLALVCGSVLLFLVTCRHKTFDHADRLALLPMDEEAAPTPTPPSEVSTKGTNRS